MTSGTWSGDVLFGAHINGIGSPSVALPKFLNRKDITITAITGTNIASYVSSDGALAHNLPVRGDLLDSIYYVDGSNTGNLGAQVTITYTVN